MNKKLHTGARILFGLAFTIFGLNGFLHFMANPPVTAEAGALLGAFAKTEYFFPMVKVIELGAGLMLLTNMYSAFAAILITPILIGITTIHLFLNPAGIPIMILLHVLHAIVACGYRNHYRPIFTRYSEICSKC